MNTNFYVNRFNRILKSQIVFNLIFASLLYLIIKKIVSPVLAMETLSYPWEVTVGKIINLTLNESVFELVKSFYLIISFLACLSFSNMLYERYLIYLFEQIKPVKWYDIKDPRMPYDKTKLQFIIGLKHNPKSLELTDDPSFFIIDEEGLYQNLINIASIGQGKTSSFIVPFLQQMLYYRHDEPDKKVCMLALDVKGNFYKFVVAYAKEAQRLSDLIILEIGGEWYYNPLHKPNLSAIELSHRCRQILDLFISNSADTYWLDKAEDTLTEYIKLLRIFNHNYLTFEEVHKITIDPEFRNKLIEQLQSYYESDYLNEEQKYDYITARNYLENEYNKLPDKAQGFIMSEITRMTQPFVTNKKVKETFCPSKEAINFYGFEDTINTGKLVVLKINANKDPKVARIIAAYLKLDCQKEIMITLDNVDSNPIAAKRPKIIINDEYQVYCTANDGEFLSQSREAKAITVASTHSYSSIKKTLRDEDTTSMLLQSFVNKIWMRCDDPYTIKKIMEHIGKEEVEKTSTSITETTQNSRVSFALGKVLGRNKNLASSSTVSIQKDYKFDEKFLTQSLHAHKAICFVSDGEEIHEPSVVHLLPFFKGRLIIKDNKIQYSNNKNEIMLNLGDIDINNLENETITELKSTDKISAADYFDRSELEAFYEPIKTKPTFDVTSSKKTLNFVIDKPKDKPEAARPISFTLNKNTEVAAAKENHELEQKETAFEPVIESTQPDNKVAPEKVIEKNPFDEYF